MRLWSMLCVAKEKGECSGVLREEGARAVLTPAKENVRQNGRRMKEPEEPMFTITASKQILDILRNGCGYAAPFSETLAPHEYVKALAAMQAPVVAV